MKVKVDIGCQKQERRKKRYVIPIIYFLLEVILVWLVLAIINVDFHMERWNPLSYVALFVASGYSLYKTYKIYCRQKNYSETE